MVEDLTPRIGLQLCAAVAVLACMAASAENLPDPTRPPAGYSQGQTGEAVGSGPVLQSILISSTRRIAIISGKTLRVGDTYGDAQVVAINENEVVLRSGKTRETLKLFPVLRKRAPSASGSRPGNELDSPGQKR
ncbi:MAG TPA: MSHA biogenesis protein MshK [Burkholderiaceae bacterium]